MIEKVVESRRVVFFIAGLWDSGTLAAGRYLVDKRKELVREFSSAGFQILLRMDAGYSDVRETIFRRRHGSV